MEVKLFDSIQEAFEVLKDHEPRLVKSNSRNICVVKRDDKIFAFQNECPHMGEPLHRGKINYLGEIVCPLHTYRFNIVTGESSKEGCNSLKRVSVIVRDGVYLDI